VVADRHVRLREAGVDLEGALVELLEQLGLAHEPGQRRTVREDDLAARVDLERAIERRLGLLEAAVLDEGRAARVERRHRVGIDRQRAPQVGLGLVGVVEHEVGDAALVEPDQRLLDVAVLLQDLLVLALRAALALPLAVDAEVEAAQAQVRLGHLAVLALGSAGTPRRPPGPCRVPRARGRGSTAPPSPRRAPAAGREDAAAAGAVATLEQQVAQPVARLGAPRLLASAAS
jgi:hypothetical protein